MQDGVEDDVEDDVEEDMAKMNLLSDDLYGWDHPKNQKPFIDVVMNDHDSTKDFNELDDVETMCTLLVK